MTDLCYKKVWSEIGTSSIIIFEHGKFATPILVLSEWELEKLERENQKKQHIDKEENEEDDGPSAYFP